MSLSRKHLAVFLLAASLACIDQPTEPTAGEGFRIVPVLPSGASLASFNLVIDSVFVEIYVYDTTGCVECQAAIHRPGGSAPMAALGRLDTVLVSQTFYWDPAAESLPLTFELPAVPPGNIFQLYLSMSAGPQTLFYGYLDLAPVRGRVVLPPIDVVYVGPGFNADSIAITPGDTSARLTDTLQFTAEAFSAGTPFDTVYIGWRTTDSTRARISYTGRLTFLPAMAGQTVGVIALVPNGVADTVSVTVPLPANAIQRVSGDSQTAPALTTLPAPIVARVLNAQGLPERGILVRFAPLGTTGTTVTDSLVFTDSLGRAATDVVLGPLAGTVDVEAMVAVNSAIKTSFHTTIAPALPIPIIWVNDSSFGTAEAIRRVFSDGTGRNTLTPLSSTTMEQALPRWAPGYARAAYSADLGNFIGLSLINAAGDSSAQYVDDISAFRPRFSPDGKHIAFQCGGSADDETNASVCVGGGTDGSLDLLAGGGNAGSRVVLTDQLPTRSTGPASYAWNPTSLTELAIVRDSIADTTFVAHSAIYRIDATGTGLALLSPDVMDVGNGPLKVVGPMDWSPDGSTIAFTARSEADPTSALYLLNVSTGEVTALTTPIVGEFGDQGDRSPVFSPDGQEILFLRIIHSGDGMNADFYVAKVADGSLRQVGYEGSTWNTSDPYGVTADWSPDGTKILMSGMISFDQTYYIVPAGISTASEYTSQRTPIGDATGSNNVRDLVASWRP